MDAVSEAIHDAVLDIARLRNLQSDAEHGADQASWAHVLDEPLCWSVRHDKEHSVVTLLPMNGEASPVTQLLEGRLA